MIWVVFPAYEEERVIGPALRALAGAFPGGGAHAVLVDDGSRDGTIAAAERAARETALPLTVLRHERNQGLGAGLRTGLTWCLARAADDDVIVTLDADNTHPPALIPALVARLEPGVDLAIASRYRPGAEVAGVPAYRRALSDLGRLVFQGLFPIPGVRDYTCCFRAFRVPPLRRAVLAYGDELCTARGFEAVMDLLLRLRTVRVRAVEMGFRLDYGARAGQSKMKVLRTIRTTLALLARRRLEQWGADAPARVQRRIAAAEARAGAGAGGGARSGAALAGDGRSGDSHRP